LRESGLLGRFGFFGLLGAVFASAASPDFAALGATITFTHRHSPFLMEAFSKQI
jgi:hypothetical protein